MRTGLILLLTFVAVPPAASACTVNSTAERMHLVELYSSEGCDSCPPAERWMSSLRTRADIAALEFHVDYWDNADWRDPYSQHAFSAHQDAISRRSNRGQVYTPQIWVDGHVWQAWPNGALPTVTGPAPALTMQIGADADEKIHVQLDAKASTSDAAQNYKLYIALTENGLANDVRGGENRGKHLSHDAVVRSFSGPLEFPRALAILNFPSNVTRAQATLIAFIQDEIDGSVVQVLRQSLAECTK